jgi:signal transduction histidine kinase/DNA-binding NarL/FixJ family response regulator
LSPSSARHTVAGPGPDQPERRAVPAHTPRTPVRPVVARESARASALEAVVEDLGAELSLRPLLERILERSIELLEGDAGSISLVDEVGGVYRKEADIGVACQSGHVFPLSEGVTGAVVERRASVTFGDYGEVRGGHVPEADRATLRAVIGVPIWWGPSIIGSCVIFSRDADRVFDDEDARLLELFATHAALAITYARLHESAEANARAEAAAEERNRMAREVHDTVAKGLVSVLLHLRVAEGAREADRAAELRTAIQEAGAAARFALEETRRSVLGLAPSPLAGSSLEEALERELAWANRTGSADVRLVVAGEAAPLRAEVAHSLFRIAQEALTNALHHADARSVRIGVVHAEGQVTLLVQDDGEGFDRDEVERAGALHGIGIRGMAERARLLGGTLEVDSTPGWGTRVRAVLPTLDGPDEPPAAARVRLLIADDHEATRAGVARLVSDSEPTIEVVGQAGSGRQAVVLWRALRPDVTLMDLRMPDGDGVEAIARIRAEDPDAAIVALTAFDHDDSVTGALRAGARGYLGKDASGADLARAVLAAAHGGALLSGDAVQSVHAHLNNAPALSEREREVLSLLERGLPDRQIADALSISVKTVEKHVGAILRKTGAQNRTEAALRGRERAAG